MKFALGIVEFPKPPIAGITIEGEPPACIAPDLNEMRLGKRRDPRTDVIGDGTAIVQPPLTDQHRFIRFDVHHGAVVTVVPAGICPLALRRQSIKQYRTLERGAPGADPSPMSVNNKTCCR